MVVGLPRVRVLGDDKLRVVAIGATKIAAAQKTRGRDSLGKIN